VGPGSCTAATASSRRVQRAITRPDRSSRGLFMRVRRRSGQLYCRQRHHCVATNPPQHRTIACTRDTYRSLQTFSTLLGSRNLQSTLLTCLLLLRDCLSAGMLSRVNCKSLDTSKNAESGGRLVHAYNSRTASATPNLLVRAQ
jgi:hypothetical protein